MSKFVQQRHKPPAPLKNPRELVLACSPMNSNINLSRIVRVAGCCGVGRIIACGAPKIIEKIARDGAETVELEVHRTLLPSLKRLKQEGYTLVALEQTTRSESLHEFRFPRRAALVIGGERQGVSEELLAEVEHVVEIPVWGLPYAYNVATATAMALYEYCRQYPSG